MNPRIPYHLLNIVMILGGVAFMLNILGLVDFLHNIQLLHFMALIGGAIGMKLVYGMIRPDIKDPITTNPLARKFFYLGMAVLATALVMRTYHLPHYRILLYLDIVIQLVSLGVSFSVKTPAVGNEEILDA